MSNRVNLTGDGWTAEQIANGPYDLVHKDDVLDVDPLASIGLRNLGVDSIDEYLGQIREDERDLFVFVKIGEGEREATPIVFVGCLDPEARFAVEPAVEVAS